MLSIKAISWSRTTPLLPLGQRPVDRGSFPGENARGAEERELRETSGRHSNELRGLSVLGGGRWICGRQQPGLPASDGTRHPSRGPTANRPLTSEGLALGPLQVEGSDDAADDVDERCPVDADEDGGDGEKQRDRAIQARHQHRALLFGVGEVHSLQNALGLDDISWYRR